ncbi:hypothetical protein [Chthonobacter albigriseus]|uniref:hypothetical protein n=1 Tax=Chthonobacter albigriseus TaxID=1683161 RepID=UPI0015EEF5EA|nr:hypothetical protein [Chthonobacter albigriseus]
MGTAAPTPELVVVSPANETRHAVRELTAGTGLRIVDCETAASCIDHLSLSASGVVAAIVDLTSGDDPSPDLVWTILSNWPRIRIITLDASHPPGSALRTWRLRPPLKPMDLLAALEVAILTTSLETMRAPSRRLN